MPKVVDHESRREHLASAVLAVVAESGLDGATARAIASRAGLSTGAVQHYFPDKDSLLRYAFAHMADRLTERIRRHLERGSDLGAIGDALCEALPLDGPRRQQALVWLAFVGHAVTSPALRTAQAEAEAGWRDRWLAPAFRRVQEQGAVAAHVDPYLAAETSSTLVDGITVQALLEPDRFPPERQRAVLFAHLDTLRGDRGTPSGVDQ